MSIRIDFDEREGIRLTDVDIRTEPPSRLEFTIEGTLAVVSTLLAEFEGATLNPVRVTVSVPDAEPISIDLTGFATLRLEDVDVGVATSGGEDLADDEPSPAEEPDVIAFTAEGTVRDVPTATFEAIADADRTPDLESITFAVEGTRLSDGGSDDVVFELTLLGYGIVVRRDGTIVIGSDGGLTGIDLL